ncbi:MAG: hypothetical protein KGZ25_08860, partial [Planctomycetes bacterium]|nr:hypothetical protein [Planctomycetota bacterium]
MCRSTHAFGKPGRYSAMGFVLTILLLSGCVARGGSRKITVREKLNQTYGRELLSYDFWASKGQCIQDSVKITGPDGPMACQLSEVDYYSKKRKFVKSAQLCFVVETLAPLEARDYNVTWGSGKAKVPEVDLRVKKAKDTVEVSTSHLSVRFPVGEGKGPQNSPPPLLGMRAEKGDWSSAGQWTGKGKVQSWSSRLTESGPVFARVVTKYVLQGDLEASFTATVIEGDRAVRWGLSVKGNQPETAAELHLPGVNGVEEAFMPAGYGQWARDRKEPVTIPANDFCFLSPNSSLINIFAEHPHHVRLKGEEVSLELVSHKPGIWVEPAEAQTYRGYDHWHLEMIPKMWEAWKQKSMPVSLAANGEVVLTADLAGGRRAWSVSVGAPRVGRQLDEINEMVLSWGSKHAHPHLFVDMPRIKELWQRSDDDAKLARRLKGRWAAAALELLSKPAEQRTKKEKQKVINILRRRLGEMGYFDVMRGAIATVSLYDALIDSGLLSERERALFRAQMAYLGYLMADPRCWSTERGYGSGNPNMHCSYILSLGVIACALRDHPMSREWASYATAWMDEWLEDEVGANGEWLPEGSHYGIVSLEPMLSFAIAARRAGYHDFTTDPRLKKLVLYFARMHTPPDPQRGGYRVTGAYGRGTSGNRLAFCGVAARMTSESDPDFSRTMQWMWSEAGAPSRWGDYRLGGYESYYLDYRLPMSAPDWGSELFPQLGALLRAAFDTEHESYVNVLACVDSLRNLDIWVPGIGSIAQWYGRGKPLSTCFTFDTGYKTRHELLRDGVRLARNYTPGDSLTPFGYYSKTHFGTFVPLPTTDYVRTRIAYTHPDERKWSPPELPAYPRVTAAKSGELDWTRQLLFVKSDDASGPAYLVLRDSVRGGEPTAWQFWTLSEKIGTPAQVRDVEAFLADKPGKTILPARQLPAGNRYTALGQFGMDVDYFIAEPTGTPRHTLRYGGTYRRVPEYQDLLHLQRPDDGAYFVAIYPRPRDESSPAFKTLDHGKVIVAEKPDGTDYFYLSRDTAEAKAGKVSFTGTVGVVQRFKDRTELTLGAPGEVRDGECGLKSELSATLTVEADSMTIDLPADSPAGGLTVSAPGAWRV